MLALYWWLFSFVSLLASVELGFFIARRGGLQKGDGDTANRADDIRDSMKQTTSIVATLTALVLGLLISDGQSSFKSQYNSVVDISINVAHLDETLAQYGDGARAARTDLRQSVQSVVLSIWDAAPAAELTQTARIRNEAFLADILTLPADDPTQRMLKDAAYKTANDLIGQRFQLAMLQHDHVSGLLLAILIVWTLVVFFSYAVGASDSALSRLALYLGAASTATAIFLVIEYQTPFDGFIQISHEPLDVLSAALAEF